MVKERPSIEDRPRWSSLAAALSVGVLPGTTILLGRDA
jgi:hypothetical protein